MPSEPKSQTETRTNTPESRSREPDLQAEPLVAPGLPQVMQRLHDDRAEIRPEDVLQLQRTLGNRAARRVIQRKLTLGAANDPYEREADQMAQQVTRSLARPMPGLEVQEPVQRQAQASRISRLAFRPPALQRQEEEEELAQGKALHGLEGGDVDQSVEQSIMRAKGGGRGLDDPVRSSMEGAFGADFSGVNIHTGPEADSLNRSLNARAFTTGNDIFFARGEYNPGSSGGRELLAHELTHTVQQGAAKVQSTRSDPGDPEEAPSVARSATDTAVQPEATTIRSLLSSARVQRQKKMGFEMEDADWRT